jgi:histidinol dehydrogenase
MELKLLRGIKGAQELLNRADPLDLSALPEPVLARTRQVFGKDITPEQSVARILKDVRDEGDEAVRRYARLLDGTELDQFRVSEAQMAEARAQVPRGLRDSLELAASRVRDFHSSVLPRDWLDREQGLGQVVRPLERVGLYAPGGTAAYPSTVLMTAIPARVAGVGEIILATPRRGGEPLNPAVLVAAEIAGVDAVFQVGGVQAIGAMAYGTESIPKVDKICGPGNIFVAYAKRLVQGQVAIDGVFGPTETLIIADESASPIFCAADLIGQAEHDPLATAILITDSPRLVESVEEELDRQLAAQPRAEVARSALQRQGRVVLVESINEAVELANRIAPEHLCLMVKEPWQWVDRVRNAGGLFLGEFSPEVMGDYIAGPSHVMPTGGTARFSSALGVHQFLRTMPVVGLGVTDFRRLGPAAVQIAQAEGLGGHAGAILVRLDRLAGGPQLKQSPGSSP